MLKRILLLCLINKFAITLAQRSNGCSLSFPIKEDKTQPIFLSNKTSNFELLIPKRGKIDLKSDESIYLFCSPSNNKLIQSEKPLTHVKCVKDTIFKINGEQYDFREFECKNTIKAQILQTNTKCGDNRGKIINIGFEATQNDWCSTIQICYDDGSGEALYAQHTIHGEAILFGSAQSYRPGFQTTGLPSKIRPSNAYKQINQKKLFAELLGSEELATNYINAGSYLSRGHLAPDADFLFAGLQYSTYFYINTCPQWSTINSGNWVSLENMVRRVADAYKKPLQVITGTHGVLSLGDINGNLQEVYLLKNKKLPVPKFVWKIVYDADRKQGIAFVISNDPFFRTIDYEDFLCPSVCKEFGWNSEKWTTIKKGFVYCCDVKALKVVIPTIPNLTIRGVLHA